MARPRADAQGAAAPRQGAGIATPLVILDLGATLVTGPSRGPASRIAEQAGLDAAQKAALRDALMTTPFAGPDEIVAFMRARGDGIGPELERTVASVWSAQRDEARPIAGAAEALRALAEQPLRFAVISNIWPPYLHSVRAHFGAFIDEHVDAELQLFSFREGHAKPSPALFRQALAVAGVAAADALMVGDSYAEDIEPAARLGLRTVWLLHRPEREAADVVRVLDGAAPTPSRTLPSIADLTADVVTALIGSASPLHAS